MPSASRNAFDPASYSTTLLEDLEKYLPEDERNAWARYQTDPIRYAEEVLGLTPWPGCREKGQRELFADIADSVKRQLAGETNVPKVFRVEAGNGIGKTYGAAMLVNWFFDCFAPSITTTTAPTKHSVEELLWKDIKKIRAEAIARGIVLTGRVLPSEPRMVKSADHWALGKTTSDAGGKGEERFKGQHDKYLLFVLDEAEGLAKFVFDAIRRMMTGGLVILVVIVANPRTRTSEFFKWGQRAGVQNYRLSSLDHPNIVEGKEVVPGATSREWVDECIEEWCEPVGAHSEDDFTFEVPWRPGVIYQPNAEFLCAVMGIPPANSADDTLIPSGRYDSAVKRWRATGLGLNDLIMRGLPAPLRFGVDVARWGHDYGAIYARLGPLVWRVAKMAQLDTTAYAGVVKAEALRLHRMGKVDGSLHIRVDAGGGFGGGVIDQLKNDPDLIAAFPKPKHQLEPNFLCIEVDFGGKAHDKSAYADMATNMMAEAAESLQGLLLVNPPTELQVDLTERKYRWVNLAGVAVKRLESKIEFRKPKRVGRSPDDGDGFILAIAPDYLFTTRRLGRAY